MSPVHIYQDLPAGCTDSRIKEFVYDLGFGDPEDFLKELLGADEKGLLCLFINLLLLQQHKVIFILLNLEKLIFFINHLIFIFLESSVLVKRILQKYSTLHLFTKALVEHLMLRRVEQMRKEEREEGGKEPYPLTIFRSNYIGPSAVEPMPGWVKKLFNFKE